MAGQGEGGGGGANALKPHVHLHVWACCTLPQCCWWPLILPTQRPTTGLRKRHSSVPESIRRPLEMPRKWALLFLLGIFSMRYSVSYSDTYTTEKEWGICFFVAVLLRRWYTNMGGLQSVWNYLHRASGFYTLLVYNSVAINIHPQATKQYFFICLNHIWTVCQYK